MKRLLTLTILSFFILSVAAQSPRQPSRLFIAHSNTTPRTHPDLDTTLPAQPDPDTARISQIDPDSTTLAPLIYLASDKLKGRDIARPEIDTAANYIATRLKKAGALPVPGASGYFQPFTQRILQTQYEFSHPQGHSFLPWYAPYKGLRLQNVLAYIPGTDSILRHQYILLSAHYDHIGLSDPGDGFSRHDSIYNGARDNATGIAAVLDAARYFGKYPPKRSVLFICFTAEEEGELGSQFYTARPIIPLDEIVFDLNVDNAGYNTTQAICLFGLGRTSADTLIRKACLRYGLAVLPEPQGLELFERSDNYKFALKGVPAPCFSMGMTKWDEEINTYYHQRSDEVGTMDLSYVVRFIRAYILAAKFLADDPTQPRWITGDLFKNAWRTLYAPTDGHH
jgi:hypothetical protein